MTEPQHVGGTERGGVREAQMQIVEKHGSPATGGELGAQLLGKGEVNRNALLGVHGTVTVIVLAGVLSLYLLLGLLFAFIYVAIQNLGGAPFFANGAAATSTRSLYFSFVTMTTVGYGDYTARTNLGHTMSVSEGPSAKSTSSPSSRRSSGGSPRDVCLT